MQLKKDVLITILLEDLNEYQNHLDEILKQHQQMSLLSDHTKKDLLHLYQQIKITKEAIAHLTLKIAVFGTTSAGKSTVINTLINQKIAPIDHAELSAGVLKFEDSGNHDISYALNYSNFEKISVEELYDQLKSSMNRYHQKYLENRQTHAPYFEVKLPLSSINQAYLSNVYEGLNVEFIDLPGIKSSLDEKNLTVIRDFVIDSFNLIILNYDDIDESRILKLYAEIRNILDVLGSQKMSKILFVLNKVDHRTNTDKPLDEIIDHLSNQIKNEFNLQQNPKIIPFSALSLFNLQAFYRKYEQSHIGISRDFEAFLENDIYIKNKLKYEGKTNPKINEIFKLLHGYEILDDEEKDTYLSNMRQKIEDLMKYTQEACGLNTLWIDLRKMLIDEFNHSLIAPKMIHSHLLHHKFENRLSLEIKMMRSNTNKLIENHMNLEKIKFEISHDFIDLKHQFQDDFNQKQAFLKQLLSQIGEIKDSKENFYCETYPQYEDLMKTSHDIYHQVNDLFFMEIYKGLHKEKKSEKILNELLSLNPSKIKVLKQMYDHFQSLLHQHMYTYDHDVFKFKEKDKKKNDIIVEELQDAYLILQVCIEKCVYEIIKEQLKLKIYRLQSILENDIELFFNQLQKHFTEKGQIEYLPDFDLDISSENLGEIHFSKDKFKIDFKKLKTKIKTKIKKASFWQPWRRDKEIDYIVFKIDLKQMLTDWQNALKRSTSAIIEIIMINMNEMFNHRMLEAQNIMDKNWQMIQEILSHQKNQNIQTQDELSMKLNTLNQDLNLLKMNYSKINQKINMVKGDQK